jgi:predicted CXXCH cytochrome family protein
VTSSGLAGRFGFRRPAWKSAISAAATAALMAFAIGTPMAFAAANPTTAVVTDVTATPTDTATAVVAATPTDTASASPTVIASATPSASASPIVSASATPSASATATVTPTPAAPAVTSLSPATQTITATAGEAIASTTAFTPDPALVTPLTYSVSPRLPAGLSLSASTGIVSGTPSTAQSATDYTVTGKESGPGAGAATATITITVSPTLSPATQAMDLIPQVPATPTTALTAAGFPDTVSYSVVGGLPTGLSIDGSSGVISGTATTPQAKTSYSIKATSTGSSGTFTATVTVDITVGCDVPGATPPDCTATPLVLSGTNPNVQMFAAFAATPDPIHGPYTMQTDTCARCHRTHTSEGSDSLLRGNATQTALCITCHDGTGAGAGAPASEFPNNPDTGTRLPNVSDEYDQATVGGVTVAGFSHNVPASAGNGHSGRSTDEDAGATPVDEFGGQSNRHSECSDCHNPHGSAATPASEQVMSGAIGQGWTPSARIAGVSGAKITGFTGSTPTFAFLNGTSDPLTRESQLCYKCHSSFTKLPTGTPDTAVQFNPNAPANATGSFHPVEAAGTNKSTAMANSLAGGTYWNFTTTGTIRCVHCHAYSAVSVTNGYVPSDVHAAPATSPNRQGILLGSFNPSTGDINNLQQNLDLNYSLCLSCHARAPFASESASATTNFRDHGKHVGSGIGCPQCHYETEHSSSGTPGVTNTGLRLVRMAPSTGLAPDAIKITRTSLNATTWTVRVSCVFSCHGANHGSGRDYQYTEPK